MVRRQIQLTEEQDDAVRWAAVERGLSHAAVIRELVEQGLRAKDTNRVARARAAVGQFASGTTDTAENHDAVLDEAFRA